MRMISRFLTRFRLAGSVLLALAAAACGDSPVDPPGSELTIEFLGERNPTLREIGETFRFQVRVVDGQGQIVENPAITWTVANENEEVVRVDTHGMITAVAAGIAWVTASVSGASATSLVTVSPDQVPVAEWDSILANVRIDEDVIVPDGQRWLIGPNVEIAGNLRTTGGTIGMRSGSSLRFVGADPDAYVGGGAGYEERFKNDIGIWVEGEGVLDIRGTPKVGWNRTGTDPTWAPDDEYYISPTQPGDYQPKRWRPGDPIPQVDPRVPSAEIINVTRDVVIEGPAHIFIRSNKPQRIEYVQLRRMGVSNRDFEGPVLARYALHFHFSGNGTQGTIVRGVSSVDSEGRVYVPHESHGITFEDVVAVNSAAEAFWWDEGDRTNDLVVDGLAATGVFAARDRIGTSSRFSVATLGGGDNMTMKNSAVSGARGSQISHGFNWPSKSDNRGNAVWVFEENNVAHNNEGSGIRLWFNSRDNHVVANSFTYRNGYAGIENGAYSNAHRYHDMLLLEDRLVQHASSEDNITDGRGAAFERIKVYSASGEALHIGRLRLDGDERSEFIDCELVPAPGSPKITFDSRAEHPFFALFRNCGVTPDDINFPTPIPPTLGASNILIEEGGKKWEVTVDMESQKKVVTELN